MNMTKKQLKELTNALSQIQLISNSQNNDATEATSNEMQNILQNINAEQNIENLIEIYKKSPDQAIIDLNFLKKKISEELKNNKNTKTLKECRYNIKKYLRYMMIASILNKFNNAARLIKDICVFCLILIQMSAYNIINNIFKNYKKIYVKTQELANASRESYHFLFTNTFDKKPITTEKIDKIIKNCNKLINKTTSLKNQQYENLKHSLQEFITKVSQVSIFTNTKIISQENNTNSNSKTFTP